MMIMMINICNRIEQQLEELQCKYIDRALFSLLSPHLSVIVFHLEAHLRLNS